LKVHHDTYEIAAANELDRHVTKINEEINLLQIRCASEESSRLEIADSKRDNESPDMLTKGSIDSPTRKSKRSSKNATPQPQLLAPVLTP
jgi:hypothetical protein